jgi:uncharacterized membrane protein YdjX (TVP38/TMEM64 family)
MTNTRPKEPAIPQPSDPAPKGPSAVVSSAVVSNRAIATVVAVAAALAAALAYWGSDLFEFVSIKTIALNYQLIKQFVADHTAVAALAYVAIYVLFAVCVLPGSPVLVIASGLLFGAPAGIALSLLSSTLAATAAFLTARWLIASRLGPAVHPALDALRAGFERHALGYMLFLRLTPGLPFAAVNVGCAVLGVPLLIFVMGTLIGFIPSRIALSTAGAGLASAIDTQNAVYSQCLAQRQSAGPDCPYDLNLASLLTWQTLAAFVAMAVLALIPALADAMSRFRRSGTGAPRGPSS